MKILLLCNKSPYPNLDGHSLVMNNIADGLVNAKHEVKILAINTSKHFVKPEEIPLDYIKKFNVELIFIDTKIKATKAFLNLFTKQSYNITRFYSEEFKNKLINILQTEEFDVVQLETISVTPYLDTIRKYSNAKVVYRSHNIEHLILERRAEEERNPILKLYLKFLSGRLYDYEKEMLNQFDGIAAISNFDRKFLLKMGCNIPIEIIQVGLNFENEKNDVEFEEFPSLFHIGAMDWMPNVDGLKWFLKNVWSNLVNKYPNLKFYIAGRNIDKVSNNFQQKGVVNCGEVESAYNFIISKGIMVVPVLYGSGIRYKIIEGMSLGKTIISTTIGAEGLDVTNDKNILIADSPKEFIESLEHCLNNYKHYRSIGENAFNYAHKNFDINNLIQKLISFYKTI